MRSEKEIRELKEELETWVNCIRHWKEISKMTDEETYYKNIFDIKREGLKRMGQNESRLHLCFFCEFEKETGFCPLGECEDDSYGVCFIDYTYSAWENQPQQKYAKTFYYELWLTFLSKISEKT